MQDCPLLQQGLPGGSMANAQASLQGSATAAGSKRAVAKFILCQWQHRQLGSDARPIRCADQGGAERGQHRWVSLATKEQSNACMSGNAAALSPVMFQRGTCWLVVDSAAAYLQCKAAVQSSTCGLNLCTVGRLLGALVLLGRLQLAVQLHMPCMACICDRKVLVMSRFPSTH